MAPGEPVVPRRPHRSHSNTDLRSCRVKVQGKVGEERYIPLTDDMLGTLRWYVDHERPDVPADQILLQDGGPPFTDETLTKLLHRFAAKAKVKGVHAHRFRHTYGTFMAEELGNVTMLKALMGHSRTETTMLYILEAQVAESAGNVSVLKIIRKNGKAWHLEGRQP